MKVWELEGWQWVWPLQEVIRVIDGDSYDLRVDIGFNTFKVINCRLKGADTYEPRGGTTETKVLAANGTAFAEDWFHDHLTVSIETFEVDSFGRWLIHAFDWESGDYLHKDLIEAGLTTGRFEE